MTGPYQAYLENLQEACALAKPAITSEMSPEQMIEAIRSRAGRIHQIHQENDRILQEILFSRTAEQLTEEEAGELSALAGALFNFNRSPDTGIAFRIHKLLYAYAQHRQDLDLMVRELYYQGITLLYLNIRDVNVGVNLFLEEIGGYFRAGADYLDRYEEIENPETRGFIVRCLGNLKYGLASFQGGNTGDGRDFCISDGWGDYMACFDRAMAVIQSPRYRQMNPEIPWDAFAYTMHYDRTQFLGGLRDRDDPAIAREVLASAEYVYRHQEQLAKVQGRAIGHRTRYVYAAARYHAGLASAGELMEVLFGIWDAASGDGFSDDDIWGKLYVPEYLTYYARRLPPAEQAAAAARLAEVVEGQKAFLFRLPQNEYALQVSKILHNIAQSSSSRDARFSRRILDYILACHPPTFVHSRVVALMARWFCQRMVRTAPALLEGTFDLWGLEGDQEKQAELLELAYRSGLYHDLGKCMLLSYVGMYSRRLLDEEFSCIKLHPIFGCQLLESLGMQKISDAAFFHHCAYDGRGGYPSRGGVCLASARRIVDIITIVDALDAGTDNVGRSYAAAKTYEQLVEELRAGAGVRYAPDVVALLDDPDFCRETGRFLAESRRQVYIEAYFHNQPDMLEQ